MLAQKKIAPLSKSDFSSLTYATLISGEVKERSVSSGLPEPPLVPPIPTIISFLRAETRFAESKSLLHR